MTDISGAPTIVTGGGNGIGRAIAKAIAKAGGKVVVVDLDLAVAETAAEEIRADGGTAIASEIDVTGEDAFETLRQLVEADYGPLRILVNCAGTILSGLPQDIPISEWQRMIEINFLSVVRANSVFLSGMIARGEGHIVNIASFAGLYPYAFDRIPYAASKAALVNMSEALALYLKPKGIGITCLCPGPVIPTAILGRAKSFSEGIDVWGPGAQFQPVTPEQVGEMAVQAISENAFFVPTHHEVYQLIQQRAANLDAFIDHQIASPQVIVKARPKTA